MFLASCQRKRDIKASCELEYMFFQRQLLHAKIRALCGNVSQDKLLNILASNISEHHLERF